MQIKRRKNFIGSPLGGGRERSATPCDRREQGRARSGAGGGKQRRGRRAGLHSAALARTQAAPAPGASRYHGIKHIVGSPRGGARERRARPADRREGGARGAGAGGGDGREPPTGGGRERRVSPADRREGGERGAGRAGGFPR